MPKKTLVFIATIFVAVQISVCSIFYVFLSSRVLTHENELLTILRLLEKNADKNSGQLSVEKSMHTNGRLGLSQKDLSEINSTLSAILKEELKHYFSNRTKEQISVKEGENLPTSLTGDEQEGRRDESFVASSRIVEHALAQGVWRASDAEAFLAAEAYLSNEDRSILREIFISAINNQELELLAMPPF